jgi:RHS repeat-associated protein
MESQASVPDADKRKLEFEYDYQSRRITKKVYLWSGSGYSPTPSVSLKFVYDGWNLIATLTSEFSLQDSFLWGLDISVSNQGAGGVGGLLAATLSGQGTHFIAYDGNGNVMALVSAFGGTVSAQYEYSPFGETLAASGSAANANPFRFSTKYTDEESDFLNYGHRYYNPSTGRWLSRDPIEEEGGYNLYAFVGNAPLDYIDPFGERAISFEINGPQTPLGFSFFLRVAASQTTCPVEVEASVFGALEWQPPGLRYLKKPFGWFNIHIEFGARGGFQSKVKYSESFGLTDTKVCGRFELFGRAEYRRQRYRGPDGRFTRFRFGAGADGGVELCLNFCNGEVTAEGTFNWYAYLHFGWRNFNRSYNFGDGYSGSWSLGSFPQAALLKDYCNKSPDLNNCCWIKKYGGATGAR